MNLALIFLSFIAGFILGAFIIWKLKENDDNSSLELQEKMEYIFGNLSRQALNQNQSAFFELAKNQFEGLIKTSESTLNEKKKLIDSTLVDMKTKLDTLTSKTVELSGQMKDSKENVLKLSDTTSKLRQILSSSQNRGQWGERMVEDILNFIGLVKGINYDSQTHTESGRPDFTFYLPMEKHVNMDVKFPLAHYENYIISENEQERLSEKKQFIKDVREHIKAIERRDYVNPAQGTVDYVLMFIPNESIYYFINQEDKNLIDFALSKKIILCSPITLYAVLSLIRQAVSNFSMEKKAGDVQNLIRQFKEQWTKFVDKMDKLGSSLSTVQKHYDELSSTRVRQLEKPMDKIAELQLGQIEEK